MIKKYLQQELAKRIDGYKCGVEITTDKIIAEMKSILVLVNALLDYEKKYNEALERAKDFKNGIVQFSLDPGESIVHYISPELRESEDERIRKWLLECVENLSDGNFIEVSKQDVLFYLEKQKEHKPVEKQDYSGLNDLERAIHRGFLVAGVENVSVTIIKETAQDCIAHMPAEWSEEDEKRLNAVVELLENTSAIHPNYSRRKLIIWLKSLRPQPKQEWSEEDKQWLSEVYFAIDHSMYSEDERQAMKKYIDSLRPSWKPGDEQMEALMLAIEGKCLPTSYMSRRLEDLYEQLEKL